MSVQARACDAPNSGGRTPGSKLPASPPPLPHPNGGGTRAVYLCTRPKKPTRHAMNRTIWNETSTITRHGDASTSAAHWSRKRQCSLPTQSTWTRLLQWHRRCFLSSRGHGRPAILPLETGTAKGMLIPMPRSEGRHNIDGV